MVYEQKSKYFYFWKHWAEMHSCYMVPAFPLLFSVVLHPAKVIKVKDFSVSNGQFRYSVLTHFENRRVGKGKLSRSTYIAYEFVNYKKIHLIRINLIIPVI
jgi:hypothetical protein